MFAVSPYDSAIAGTITVSPGTNIQMAINAHQPGTTFVLTSGVYRQQTLQPRDGDIFTGQSGAILNGSTVVTNWVKQNGHWTSSGEPALAKAAGPSSKWCRDGSTGCVYPQDLFLNNRPLVHKLSLPISSGQWYFNYGSRVIYMADNPGGQTVELSVSQNAFKGNANNVTVQGLTIEKYAAPLLGGAIQPTGSGWVIQNNTVMLNHGEGIKVEGNNEQVLNNSVHDNEEEGACAGGGTGDLFKNNNVYNNNNNSFAKVAYGIEMGGGKFSSTTNAQIINNTFSNNDGNGIWVDGLAVGTSVKGNTVTRNIKDGIRCEYSHNCMISGNTLVDNDQNSATGACTLYSREITITASDHATVTGNTITSNCAGIYVGGQQRNEFIVPFDNVVTDNSITYTGSGQITNLIGGMDKALMLFNPANENYFDYNSYHFNSAHQLTVQNWMWGGYGNLFAKNWSQWRAAGQDTHGSAD